MVIYSNIRLTCTNNETCDFNRNKHSLNIVHIVSIHACDVIGPTFSLSLQFYIVLFLRLGEVRLRDICSLFDKHGSYRYHFKTLDPEFGTVKEEVSHGSTPK